MLMLGVQALATMFSSSMMGEIRLALLVQQRIMELSPQDLDTLALLAIALQILSDMVASLRFNTVARGVHALV